MNRPLCLGSRALPLWSQVLLCIFACNERSSSLAGRSSSILSLSCSDRIPLYAPVFPPFFRLGPSTALSHFCFFVVGIRVGVTAQTVVPLCETPPFFCVFGRNIFFVANAGPLKTPVLFSGCLFAALSLPSHSRGDMALLGFFLRAEVFPTGRVAHRSLSHLTNFVPHFGRCSRGLLGAVPARDRLECFFPPPSCAVPLAWLDSTAFWPKRVNLFAIWAPSRCYVSCPLSSSTSLGALGHPFFCRAIRGCI